MHCSTKHKVILITFMMMYLLFIMISSIDAQPKSQEESIQITLSVYSGRPNPQWNIEPGSEYERLIHLIRELEIKDEILFEYEEWNQLGYASFWVYLPNIEGLPDAIHVWRDMAYILHNEKGEAMYALNAIELYDMLVAQAEKNDQGEFFINYRNLSND